MPMKKSRLVFGVTSTQPVGATDDEIEDVYQRAYKPFLKTLYNAPDILTTLHFSGQLLLWLDRHHSEYTDVLSEMVARKQVELLGGGFYDPVFTIIPRPDRIGQVESLTTYLRKRFGKRPRGSWITQHIWEPSLASTMKSSGMEYVFLDDHHFRAAGLTGENMQRPCLTEDQGKTIIVFPVSNALLAAAREKTPEEVLAYIKSQRSDDPSRVLVLIDECERYVDSFATKGKGATDDSWLHQFVYLVRENREWLGVELPSSIRCNSTPQLRGYFASAFFDSANPETNGCFRHNITRYPESNLMYAKMQYIHVLVNQIRGDKYRKQAAREELWKAQCHSAYWHGEHEGIYRNRLRKQVYRSLIEAEKRTRERGIFQPSIVTVDFDMDGLDEYLFQGQDINAYVHRQGGMLFELDYLPKPWNYLDTLGRHKESYHTPQIAARGYDPHPRRSFMDHFLDPATTLKEFEACRYSGTKSYLECLYECVNLKRDSHLLHLQASGAVPNARQNGSRSRSSRRRSVRVVVDKRYRFRRGGLQVDSTIQNNDQTALRAVFAPELNFAFLSQEADHLRFFAMTARTEPKEFSPAANELSKTGELQFNDLTNEVSITIGFSEPADLWSFPVITMGRTADGIQPRYQSSVVVPRWQLTLEPAESAQVCITLKLEKS
jgi:hypothetical protein